MKEIIKKYSNGEVTVVWQPAKCIHSKICWEKATGLPEVFNPQVRPWINMDGAETDQIVEQVKKCPTEALSFFWNDEANTEDEDQTVAGDDPGQKPETIVQVMKNGPLLVFGNIIVKDPDGNETRKNNVTSFCRCGVSKTHPYCDGTHFDVDFKG
ncbi:MAG: (4Fe-4S)-binding protein [Bacteroidota bacterium]